MITKDHNSKDFGVHFLRCCGVALGSLLWLLLLDGCVAPTPPAPIEVPSALQTSQEHYQCDNFEEDFGLTITNQSPFTITTGRIYDLLVYRRIDGWRLVKMQERYSSPLEDAYFTPFTLGPGQSMNLEPLIEFRRQTIFSTPCDDIYRIALPYQITASQQAELEPPGLMYVDVNVGEPPPRDVGGLAWVTVELTSSRSSVSVTNNMLRGSEWIIPFCSQAAQELISYDPQGYYPFATLERKTDWGTWETLFPEHADCTEYLEQIEILPENEETISLWQGSNFDLEDLPPGVYRWHIVVFGSKYEIDRIFDRGHHRFLEEFQVSP